MHRAARADPSPDGACAARPDSGAGEGLRADEVSHHHQVSADSFIAFSTRIFFSPNPLPTFCVIPSLQLMQFYVLECGIKWVTVLIVASNLSRFLQ